MSRSAEKAQAALNKWDRLASGTFYGKDKRPYLATECHDLNQAKEWRLEIVKETSRKIQEIQNASLGEFKIRELNDNINKLIRERRHWERRIVDLGGTPYPAAPKPDAEGNYPDGVGDQGVAAYGSKYIYFGQAKNLPGVREVFEDSVANPKRRTKKDLTKGITPEYYGFRDEGEEGSYLAGFEQQAEDKHVAEWKADRAKADAAKIEAGEKIPPFPDPARYEAAKELPAGLTWILDEEEIIQLARQGRAGVD